jgi:hypothetical protein
MRPQPVMRLPGLWLLLLLGYLTGIVSLGFLISGAPVWTSEALALLIFVPLFQALIFNATATMGPALNTNTTLKTGALRFRWLWLVLALDGISVGFFFTGRAEHIDSAVALYAAAKSLLVGSFLLWLSMRAGHSLPGKTVGAMGLFWILLSVQATSWHSPLFGFIVLAALVVAVAGLSFSLKRLRSPAAALLDIAASFLLTAAAVELIHWFEPLQLPPPYRSILMVLISITVTLVLFAVCGQARSRENPGPVAPQA